MPGQGGLIRLLGAALVRLLELSVFYRANAELLDVRL
jgi:hypothetical protein